MLSDAVNGGFELAGAVFVLNHCRTVLADRSVKGVSILSTAFFACWGIWNLYYYPSLGQVWSFAGGVAIVIANALWIGLMLKYREGNLQ